MYDYSMRKEELKEKLLQMFILGYKDAEPSEEIWALVSAGLGGIIFFAENLKNRSEFKSLSKRLQKNAKIPLFLSIDQEGGLVERTIFLDVKNDYLTPKALSNLDDKTDIKTHYELLARDLKDLGLNLNFAPVLDVNTNPYNPIINVRAFGNDASTVMECMPFVLDAYKENHIITCGKHFAGHGDTSIDSHLNMPCVSMEYDKFYKNHLICFEQAIKNGLETIMVSHVHFPFFDEVKTPASLSKNAIEIYLKRILKFDGLIFTDDMVMGGISKNYGLKESIILAIQAGIDMLIFRNITTELLNVIDEIVILASQDKELETKITKAYEKILKFKQEKLKDFCQLPIKIQENQKIIDKIAEKTIIINKKGKCLPLDKNAKITIVSFNNKEIFNLSSSLHSLGYFLQEYNVEEYKYPIDPTQGDIQKIRELANNYDVIIFLAYNAHMHDGQINLFNELKAPKILVNCALDYDIQLFDNPDSIISLGCAKEPSIKALSKLLIQN